MDLISIIVPIYKVEKYLDRCINSLVNQTYNNIEIILVDDGSPDNCGKMCDEWAKRDNRIKVIHKENAGLGYARNSGLAEATGDYVMFVDSDDYIKENTCELVLGRIKQTNAQICSFGHVDDFDGVQKITSKSPEKLEYTGNEVIDFYLADALAQNECTATIPYVMMSAWSAMYYMSVIKDNNVRFLSERDYLNEDLFFRVEICKHIKKAAVLKEDLYCYCHNGASLSTSYRDDRFQGSLRMYQKLKESLDNYMERADIENRCKRAFMNNLIVCLKQEAVHIKEKGFKNLTEKYKQIVNNEEVYNTISSYPIECLPLQQKLLFGFVKKKRILSIYMLVKMNCMIKAIKNKK